MVTLELPQARRLAASVVLGQVVVTSVAAVICFAVWGRVAGLSALVGGGISVMASAALAFFGAYIATLFVYWIALANALPPLAGTAAAKR